MSNVPVGLSPTGLRAELTNSFGGCCSGIPTPPPPTACGLGAGFTFSTDFELPGPNGMTLYGNATVAAGALKLTPAASATAGMAKLVQFNPAPIEAFRATFKLYIGGGSSTSADGFSFNLADDNSLVFAGAPEEGIGTGLTVEFDTFSNGAGDQIGIFLKSGGPATSPINGTPFQPSQGPSVTAPGWKNVEITMDSCGYVNVIYDGVLRATGQVPYVPGPNARFALAARTGFFYDNHWVDDLLIITETAAPNVMGLAPPGQCCAHVNFEPPCFSSLSPITSTVCIPPSGACFGVGVTRVCCTATDSAGNQGHSAFNVVVKDQVPPLVNCGNIQPLTLNGGCIGYVPNYLPAFQASDDCGPVVITQNPPPGSLVGPGVTTVTLTACDTSGNCASCTVPYTVVALGFGLCSCGGMEPPPGLVLWLPFDEPPVSPFPHNVAGGNNGIYQGAPSVLPGYVDASLCFYGVNYVTVPYYPAIDFTTGDFSIDAWVRRDPNDTGGGIRMIVNHLPKYLLTVGSYNTGYGLYLMNDTLTFQMLDAGGGTVTTTGGPIVPLDNQWHFVAVTVKRSSSPNNPPVGRLYMDNSVPVVFNPTPASGSLANLSGVVIGASYPTFIPASQFFKGCIDEVEIFNRELGPDQPEEPGVTIPGEVTHLFRAGQKGKCKLSCSLPNVGFCSSESSKTVTATLCNKSASPATFIYGLTGLLPNCGTLPVGPSIGTLPASIYVPPWTCQTVTFTVPRPPNLTLSQWGCLRLVAQVITPGNPNGKAIECRSVVYNAGHCFYPSGTGTVVIKGTTGGGGSSFHFAVPVSNPLDGDPAPPGTNMVLQSRFRVVGPDGQDDTEVISLNGLPPGTYVTNTTMLAFGESTTLELNGQFLWDDPNNRYDIWFEYRNEPGDWELLDILSVVGIFQASLEVNFQEAGGVRQPNVSWSGFGTLQCAPTLNGPWTDLPEAANPYAIPPGGTNGFYRLR